MQEPKTILQVTAKAPNWGFDLFQQIEKAYLDAGHRVATVFLNGAPDEAAAVRYQGQTHFLGLNHKQPFWRIQAVWQLKRIAQQLNPDLVIAHHYKPSSIMAFLDRLSPFAKLYMVNHNPGNLRRQGRQWVARHLFSQRWRFLTVSDWVRRDFLLHAQGIDPERVQTLYNCIDIDTISNRHLPRTEARKDLGLPPDAFVFGNIHRLDPSKGHDYLIRAFAMVAKQMPDARLVIIGGGERQAFLQSIADQEGVADQVTLAGLIPEASRFTPAFDAFVIPSLHEGFGLGLLEGMATKIPTIASTGGALTEVVGDTGLTFPPGDTTLLAGQLLRLYRMPEKERRDMGQAAYRRLQENFTPKIYHRNFLHLLD